MITDKDMCTHKFKGLMKNDLISRQLALTMLNDNELERQADDVFDGSLHRYKRAAQRIIAQLPSAEKCGKWVAKDKRTIVCSICGDIWGRADLVLKYLHYCPNCGSKMERSEE